MIWPVVVTTEYKGVFFGYASSRMVARSRSVATNKITLENARMAIRWGKALGGFLGLAAFGPDDTCLVGPKVEKLILYGVTSITTVTKKAESKWQSAPSSAR